jgi:hypothetical protein
MGDCNRREVSSVDAKTRNLLALVLDMTETEMRAALIAVVNGIPFDQAIDAAYNYMRREAMKLRRPL